MAVGLIKENPLFHNILIIKPSSLGDVVRAVPVFNGLRKQYPNARISWLIRPDCGGILQNLTGLDEIIEFDRKKFARIGRSFRVTAEFIRFLKMLRQKEFDLVLDLQGLFRSGFISRATGAAISTNSATLNSDGLICRRVQEISTMTLLSKKWLEGSRPKRRGGWVRAYTHHNRTHARENRPGRRARGCVCGTESASGIFQSTGRKPGGRVPTCVWP